MSDQAMKFVKKAERLANDRKRLRGDGEAVARWVLTCAERVSMLDDRVFRRESREACLARIWDAYQVVVDYLESGAPYNLDSPEVPLYGDFLNDLGNKAADEDWDGNPQQVMTDNQYEGY